MDHGTEEVAQNHGRPALHSRGERDTIQTRSAKGVQIDPGRLEQVSGDVSNASGTR
jgi:hypothetical protein